MGGPSSNCFRAAKPASSWTVRRSAARRVSSVGGAMIRLRERLDVERELRLGVGARSLRVAALVGDAPGSGVPGAVFVLY